MWLLDSTNKIKKRVVNKHIEIFSSFQFLSFGFQFFAMFGEIALISLPALVGVHTNKGRMMGCMF